LLIPNNSGSANNILVKDVSTFLDKARDENQLVQVRPGTSIMTSTTQSKFGGRSLYLNGSTTNYLRLINTNPQAAQKPIELANNNFTLECWFYPTSWNSNSGLQNPSTSTGGTPILTFGLNATGDKEYLGPYLGVGIDNTLRFGASYDNTTARSNWDYLITTTTVPTLNTWHHVACVRNGSNLNLYYDGNLIGSTSCGYIYTSDNFLIGHYTRYLDSKWPANYARSLLGYIDEVRVKVGTAEYTSNFTPPTVPFLP
jgi:hypothetical protein